MALPLRPLMYQDMFVSATFSFWIQLPSTRIWQIRHTNLLSRVEMFEYAINLESCGC